MKERAEHVQNVRSKRAVSLAVLAGLLVVVCVGVSYFMTNLMIQSKSSWEHHDQEHGHRWLHEELDLTESEIAAVDAFEPEYRKERDALLAEFNRRIATLREMLVSQASFSPEANAAIHQIHAVHSQLQERSIRHYYDMMSVLPPDKQEKLRHLAVEALSEPE